MELWDSKKTCRKAIDFSASWDNKSKPAYDDLLISYQLKLDNVYSSELHKLGYINNKQFKSIKDGLGKLSKQCNLRRLSVKDYEDVHSAIESKLHEMYSPDLVGNVHLGLSRNDQIISLMRMYMNDKVLEIQKDLKLLTGVIKKEIIKKGSTNFVGYTHHRVAMPTTYGELLKSYIISLDRDKKSLKFWFDQYNECPLGTGAGFGSPIKIDRIRISKNLGFKRPTKNSIDTVTTRWEAEIRLADIIKVMMNHLSTIAQDFIINSMEGINIISLPPEYCTGSSIMPQKLNPDILETIKRKAIDISGEALKLSSVGRGNISGYNRDTQGTKYWIMNIFQEFDGCLEIMSEIIKDIKINEKKVNELLKNGGAYTALEAINESIEKKKPYRTTKINFEKHLKPHIFSYLYENPIHSSKGKVKDR